jgi:uncharacterized coiled-coil DUF342 family protein
MNNTERMALKCYNNLTELYEKIYSDESTDEFDELHDDVYWQIQGFNHSMYQAEDDEWDEEWNSEFEEVIALTKKLDDYRKDLMKYKEGFNWIYG